MKPRRSTRCWAGLADRAARLQRTYRVCKMQLAFAVVTGSVAMWACYALGITLGPFVSSWAMYGDAGHSLGSLVGLACGAIVGGWVAGRMAKPIRPRSAKSAIVIAPGSWLLIAWTLMTWHYLAEFWREADPRGGRRHFVLGSQGRLSVGGQDGRPTSGCS